MKRQNDGRSVLLTAEQERWLEVQRSLSKLRAMPRYLPPRGAWRARVFDVVTAQWFDLLVISVIVANAATMATYHWGLPSAWDSAIHWLNIAFTALFLAEAAAKIIALGGAYFRVWWARDRRRVDVRACLHASGPPAAVRRGRCGWASRWRQSSRGRVWGR
jgi:hypothetical protein